MWIRQNNYYRKIKCDNEITDDFTFLPKNPLCTAFPYITLHDENVVADGSVSRAWLLCTLVQCMRHLVAV
jgi:hypothetical protein